MANEVSGIDILIDVNTGTIPSPVWTLVGGQRGATLKRTTDVADAKHKSSGAWQNRVSTFLDWAITGDAVLINSDAALDYLDAAWRDRQNVQVRIRYPSGKKETGLAVIADYSVQAPHDGVATVSLDLQGNGELTVS